MSSKKFGQLGMIEKQSNAISFEDKQKSNVMRR